MDQSIEIEIMADSCNGEESAFAEFCKKLGYSVDLRSESGVGSADEESHRIGNELWELYCNSDQGENEKMVNNSRLNFNS